MATHVGYNRKPLETVASVSVYGHTLLSVVIVVHL